MTLNMQRPPLNTHDHFWVKMRSDIYIRDKGICWVCDKFVTLKQYDLGHLIDRSIGGSDTFDNLAVMHHDCNMTKPRHKTIDDATQWKQSNKLPKRNTTDASVKDESIRTKPFYPATSRWNNLIDSYTTADKKAIKELVIEYFRNHPNLLLNHEGYNKERISASRQIAIALNITLADIRTILVENGLIKRRPPQITDGSQYRYVSEHLDELVAKYETIKHEFLYNQPKLLGISVFCMDIMFYLSGRFNKVSKCNFANIDKRVKQLNLPIHTSYQEKSLKVTTL